MVEPGIALAEYLIIVKELSVTLKERSDHQATQIKELQNEVKNLHEMNVKILELMAGK